jgi:aspartyl-tRNA synthetase
MVIGGSIRIHESEKQEKVFQKLNFPIQTIQNFSHLLEALKYGCPPHGGLALGLDRLVALTCGAVTLRDVIAFPKTGTGADLMAQAPAALDRKMIEEFGLEFQKNLNKN